MNNRIDHAKAYYWRMQFVDPENPDDERYVMLYGEEGEVLGPMTMLIADAWMRSFGGRSYDHSANLPFRNDWLAR
jgi:hypothetical protein